MPLDTSFPSEINTPPDNPTGTPHDYPSSPLIPASHTNKEIRVYTRRERNKQVTNPYHSQ